VLPPTLRGRVALGPAQVAVLAVLVALGLAVACWWVVRGGAEAVVAPVVPTPAAVLVSPAGTPSGGTGGAPVVDAGATPVAGTGGSVTVDVAGKVRHPGIAVLDAGSRVVDALEAAGGARPGVDLSGLNLARVLVDGEQVVVGVPAPADPVASAASSPGAPPGPLVNLNTATQPELEALPEVGPVTAQSILGWRSEHGGFTSVDELLEVDGFGDATLDQLAPYVTV
jgi:competence protein ComEA